MRVEDINFFYINCKIDSIKNENILLQWEKCCKIYNKNIPINRRDAVHYNDYSYPYFSECFQPEDSKIKNQISNIAVLKSHSNLWKFIWDNDLKYNFIFEDDVIIPETFLKDLEKILNENNFVNKIEKWDIIYFGILRMYCQKTKFKDFHKMLNKKGYNNGLHAYFLHKNTSGKLLNLITKIGAENQIDILLRDQADKFNFYVYKELLIKQDVDKFESTRLGRFVKDEFKIVFDEINLSNEHEQQEELK